MTGVQPPVLPVRDGPAHHLVGYRIGTAPTVIGFDDPTDQSLYVRERVARICPHAKRTGLQQILADLAGPAESEADRRQMPGATPDRTIPESWQQLRSRWVLCAPIDGLRLSPAESPARFRGDTWACEGLLLHTLTELAGWVACAMQTPTTGPYDHANLQVTAARCPHALHRVSWAPASAARGRLASLSQALASTHSDAVEILGAMDDGGHPSERLASVAVAVLDRTVAMRRLTVAHAVAVASIEHWEGWRRTWGWVR